MSADVDKLLRAIYIQAEMSDDIDTFKKQLRGIIGKDNVAIALDDMKDILESKEKQRK